MRYAGLVGCLLLVGCAGVHGDYPAANAVNFATDILNPGARQAAQAAADDQKCQSFGFRTGTDQYGGCRLELERLRATGAPIRVQVR